LDDVHGRLAETRAHDHRPDQRRTRGGQGVGGLAAFYPPNDPSTSTQPRVTSICSRLSSSLLRPRNSQTPVRQHGCRN
jgi:hypothetical protein